MSSKILCMEIRPRLHSINVFLKFTKPILFPITIKYVDNSVVIVSDSKTVEKINCVDFEVLKDSITSLNIKDEYVTFRFCTKDLGIMKLDAMADLKLQDAQEEILIDNNLEYDLKCTNCKNHLFDKIKFNRILPLPSTDIDEWFCHAPEFKFNLDPKVNDLLYTSFSIHFNLNLLRQNVVLLENRKIECESCKSELGTIVRQTCKIWRNTILLVNISENVKLHASPFEDCARVIENSLKNFMGPASKILIGDASKFIFLWLLEKDLELYIEERESGQNLHVAKVLFKIEDVKEDETIKKWQKDQSVDEVEVTSCMINELEKQLFFMQKYIPLEFSKSNDFLVSYLKLNLK